MQLTRRNREARLSSEGEYKTEIRLETADVSEKQVQSRRHKEYFVRGVMTAYTKEDVRDFLLKFLAGKLKERGNELPEDVPNNCNLLLSGYLDSLGFVELMAAAQDRFEREIDFDRLDPDKMVVFGSLSEFVSQQLANQV